jgi:hypothetical protein
MPVDNGSSLNKIITKIFTTIANITISKKYVLVLYP